jgi:hypothetical protein
VRGALFIACFWAGCGQDPCGDFAQSCLALEVRSAAGESLSVDQLELVGLEGFSVPGDNRARTPAVPRDPAVVLPVLVAVLPPPDYVGAFQLQVSGRLAGDTLRHGIVGGSISANQHLQAVVILDHREDGSIVGDPDLANPLGSDLRGVDLRGIDLAQPAGVDLAGPCDPTIQDCAPGQKCTLTGGSETGEPICVANGTLPTGSACDPADDQCVAGRICLSLTGVDKICRKLCDTESGDEACPQPAALDAGRAEQSHCLALTVNGTLGECTTPCNPVTAAGPSGCPASQMCYFIPFLNADVLGLTDCTSIVGTLTDGQVCTRRTDCAPGFYCREITQGGQLVCRQMCRLGTDSDCSLSGYKCVQDIVSFGGCCPNGTC